MLIQSIADRVCSKNTLGREEREDFGSWLNIKLMEDDCRVLRAHEGRSSLKTYLTVVITNYFRDYRNSRWGKWRVSAAARQIGKPAELLETFLVRDGRSFEEAYILITNHHDIKMSKQALADIEARLPYRAKRRMVDDDELTHEPARERADSGLEARVRDETRMAIQRAILRACDTLDTESRLVLKMVYGDGMKVSEVSRGLGLKQRKLYSLLEKLLEHLRKSMEIEKIGREEAMDFLRIGDPDLDLDFGIDSEDDSYNPSNQKDGNPPRE